MAEAGFDPDVRSRWPKSVVEAIAEAGGLSQWPKPIAEADCRSRWPKPMAEAEPMADGRWPFAKGDVRSRLPKLLAEADDRSR